MASDNAPRDPAPTPLEVEKWHFERTARERDLALKEREQVTKEEALALQRTESHAARWRNPLVVAIFAAAVAAAGNAVVSWTNGNAQRDLESQRAEEARILEMLKTGDPDKAAVNLRFIIDAGLISDAAVKQRLSTYLSKPRQTGTGPSLLAEGSKLASPIIDNARIYLLAGKKDALVAMAGLREELGSAGFAIVGSRVKEDAGRPDHPEVRYFNAVDKQQAEKVAEFMRFKLGTKALLASEYQDPTAKAGYIEIWLGR